MASSTPTINVEALSARALEILQLLADGLSDREIAQRLVLTVNTVKWYNRQIYGILGVGSRTKAVVRARELELLNKKERGKKTRFPLPQTSKHQIPADITRFVGRKSELEALRLLLPGCRLITLTGPPGTGKTRLASQLGRELVQNFAEGVYFVSLAPLDDPALVGNAIAAAVGVKEVHGQSIRDSLNHGLEDRELLLILDNFEHLLPAAPLVSDLLRATEKVKVVVTSREPLQIYGEQEYPVPIMRLPTPDQYDLDQLISCESLVLFLERAQAVKPDFQITADNAMDVARICVRLDGLPLAIELAAARIKLLPPNALLARLDSRLKTLTGGPRDFPERQRTLRHTLDWSFKLLNEEERMLFSRLAVFRGGRNRASVEAICAPGLPFDWLAGVESLLNKSLLYQQPTSSGEPRLFMLETIHEYAWDQLEAGGEAEAVRGRHAAYFVELAELAEPELRRRNSATWMTQLEFEIDNLRAALEWSLTDGQAVLGLRLAAVLRDFWVMSSRFTEGQRWTQQALARSNEALPGLRARLLTAVGYLMFTSTDPLRGKAYLEEAVTLAREGDDRQTLAWALTFLGSASIGLESEFETALEAAEEGLLLFQNLEHGPGMAQVLNIMGELMRTNGDIDRAQAAYEECLRLVRETGEVRRESMILGNLGFIAHRRGDLGLAEAIFKEAFIKALELGYDKYLIISQFVNLAGIMAASGELKKATLLFGAAEALLEPMGAGMQPGNQREYENALAVIRSQIDDSTLTAWWREGRSLTLEQVVATILELNKGSHPG